MRSAEEVADKLWEDCRGVAKAAALPFIVQALAEFAEERCKEVDAKYAGRVKEIMDKARAEALGQCLAIAKDYTGQGVLIAEKIRELKEKE